MRLFDARDREMMSATQSNRSMMADVVVDRFYKIVGLLLFPLVFSHLCYARHYLGSVVMTPFAMLHYIFIGEDRGWIPNPFFDPTYFQTQCGSISFMRYLGDRDMWGRAPSRWFGSPRYEGGPGSSALVNPLAAFWLTGLAFSRRPTPTFEPRFVRDALCRDRFQKRWMLFQLAVQRASVLPTNRHDLHLRQCAYRGALDYEVLRATPSPRHKNLVFIQAGSNFVLDAIDTPRDFDIMINFYDRPAAPPDGADVVTRQPGTKTTAIATLLRRDPDLLLRYESVLFLDDDIEIERRQISRLFDLFHAEGLDLAQASLTAQSSCYFSCLKQPRAGHTVTRMNGVEIMMPLVSRRALDEFGWIFSEGVSGWGVDLLLSAKVRERFGDTIGLIGEVVVAHERPTDTATGALYVALRSHGIDANSEAGDIVQRHKIQPFQQRIRSAPLNDH